MMRKYMKQLALSVVTLCMIFTLATGNVVNAANTKAVVYYHGVNFSQKFFEGINSNNNVTDEVVSKKFIRINPSTNVSPGEFGSVRGKLFGLVVENDNLVDEFGNTYRHMITEQSYGGKKYSLVGWKVDKLQHIWDMEGKGIGHYLTEGNGYYFENKEDAKKACDFTLDEYIDLNTYNKNSESIWGSKRMTLAAVYTSKKIPYGEGSYEYVSGDPKYQTKREEINESTIKSKVDYVNREIVFTIPSDYSEDEIQLKLDDELVEIFAFKNVTAGDDGEFPFLNKPGVNEKNPPLKENFHIEPGDMKDFKIKIVNESKNSYGYVDKSLRINTPKLSTYNLETDKGVYTNPMPKGMKGFDGQDLMVKFTPTRTPNNALKSLVKSNDSLEVYNTISNDEKLGSLLNEIYGENSGGVDNLNKYYLDFYNAQYGTKHSRLDQFTENQLFNMFYDDLESGGAGKMVVETNVEVAETLYKYFYNAVLGVAPYDLIKDDGARVDQTYTVGNIMANGYYIPAFENYMNELTVLRSNEGQKTESILNWGFHIDGEYDFNIFNNMDYGFEMGFKLEKKVGDVTVDKHIELGGFDKNNTPTFMFKLTDVNGNTYFKTISFNEGETDKQVVFKDIPYGKYTVEEIDPIRYEVLGQPVLEGVLDDVKQSGYVQYVNTKVKDNDFSDTNLVINSFKKGDNSIEISKKEHNNGKRG